MKKRPGAGSLGAAASSGIPFPSSRGPFSLLPLEGLVAAPRRRAIARHRYERGSVPSAFVALSAVAAVLFAAASAEPAAGCCIPHTEACARQYVALPAFILVDGGVDGGVRGDGLVS